MTKARDAFEDLVGGLRPHERLGIAVGELDVPADGHLELAGAAVDAPTQLLLGERGEPAFHEVDPRGPRRSEMQVDARVARQPAMDRRSLVRTGVVENQM